MAYTVSDLYRTYFAQLKLIAGKGGLARSITGCGILDYELMPELKDRYFHSNFQEGQFIVSSLLYTRDNPYMLTEAIKHLMAKGASGLAIRNVFRLQIPENVIRYADARNFPIFLVPSVDLPFETIIYTISRQLELERSASYHQEVLNHLMTQPMAPEETRQWALKLNPSFVNQYFCIYFQMDEFAADLQKAQLIDFLRSSGLFTYEDFLCVFRRGILIVKSSESIAKYYNDGFIVRVLNAARHKEAIFRTGISSVHNTLTEFRQALDEVLFASAYNMERPGQTADHLQYYRELGSFQLIFPYCSRPEFVAFSRHIMDRLEEYDAENGTSLTETLTAYIQCDSSLERTATLLSQHEQTIRYRLNKIYSLTSLDRKSPSDAEQLSLACKIYLAGGMLGE
ncbi:MAG: PucR family transcriptional regulator [Firmicutes bacterium]|nr:PucR family transcriptional regulator [Bacillota bacterium]